MMRVLDLFSGIGGFSLGLERTGGFETVAFCEIEPYCQAVLRKHWPEVPVYDDVRKLTIGRLAADGIEPAVICGGFPCQDISGAGLKAGIGGERSGLWSDFARLIGELRPRYAIVENVADLLVRGIGRVLGDLAALGYDAEWHAIPACAVGADHERDRVWVIAYPDERQQQNRSPQSIRRGIEGAQEGAVSRAAPDTTRYRRGQGRQGRFNPGPAREQAEQFAPPADAPVLLRPSFVRQQQDRALREHWTVGWQEFAASLRGVDDGVPGRIYGLAALGNTLVPQIPEMIGRAILASARQQSEEDRRSDKAFPQPIQQPDTNNSSRRIA